MFKLDFLSKYRSRMNNLIVNGQGIDTYEDEIRSELNRLKKSLEFLEVEGYNLEGRLFAGNLPDVLVIASLDDESCDAYGWRFREMWQKIKPQLGVFQNVHGIFHKGGESSGFDRVESIKENGIYQYDYVSGANLPRRMPSCRPHITH